MRKSRNFLRSRTLNWTTVFLLLNSADTRTVASDTIQTLFTCCRFTLKDIKSLFVSVSGRFHLHCRKGKKNTAPSSDGELAAPPAPSWSDLHSSDPTHLGHPPTTTLTPHFTYIHTRVGMSPVGEVAVVCFGRKSHLLPWSNAEVVLDPTLPETKLRN